MSLTYVSVIIFSSDFNRIDGRSFRIIIRLVEKRSFIYGNVAVDLFYGIGFSRILDNSFFIYLNDRRCRIDDFIGKNGIPLKDPFLYRVMETVNPNFFRIKILLFRNDIAVALDDIVFSRIKNGPFQDLFLLYKTDIRSEKEHGK